MKSRNLAVLIAAIVLANGNVLAEESHHPDGAPANQPSSQQSGMGMMDGKMMERMQENMKKMQTQMLEIRNTKDDATRDRLMDEHMQSMDEGMAMMRGMGGGMMQGMMGAGMQNGKGMEGGMKEGMAPAADDMMGRMGMMEKRMDMMQMMMEQQVQSKKVERIYDHRKTK